MTKKLDPRRYLHPAEIRLLRAWIARERAWAKERGRKVALRDTYVIETLIACGPRRFEVAGLRVRDVPSVRGIRRLHVARGKGGTPRDVPIPRALRDALHGWIEAKATLGEDTGSEAPLFTSIRGGFLSPSAVHKVWCKARHAAGLERRPGVAVHAARHGAAVALYQKTKDILLVKEALGHARLDTTLIYARTLEEDIERGLDAAWEVTAPDEEAV